MEPETATVTAAVIAAFASLIAAFWSNHSKKASFQSEKKAKIRQARIDERDRISKLPDAFLIPTGNDGMWRDYYQLVEKEGMSRVEASNRVQQQLSDSIDPIVKEPTQ